MTLRSFCLYTLIALPLLTACDKDDEPAGAPASNQFVNPISGVADAAVLITADVNSGTPVTVPGVPDVDITLDVPVGIFLSGGNQVDAGTVSIDAKKLENLGGVYTLGAGAADPATGLFAYDKRAWSVGGAGTIPSIAMTPSRAQPALGTLSAPDELVRGDTYAVGVASVANADSVYFLLGSDVIKRFRGSTRSYTFTAAETERATPQDGQITVQVAAFTIEQRTQGALPVYLIGESVRNKFVTVR